MVQDPQGFVPANTFCPGGLVEVGHGRTRFTLPGGGNAQGQFYFALHVKWVSGVITIEEKWIPDYAGQPLPVVLDFNAQNFGRCVSFPNHGTAGTRFFTLGIEASRASSLASFVEKHYINTVQYRCNSSWVNVSTPLPFEGITVDTPTGPSTHGGNADLDLRMCTATTANKVIGWVHDN